MSGTFDPARWPEAVAVLDRLTPAGLHDVAIPAAPTTATGVIEALAQMICEWWDHLPPPRRRTAVGRSRTDIAILAMGSPPLTTAALTLAVEVMGVAAGKPASEAWAADARARLLAMRKDGANWLRGSRRHIARAAEARDIPWRQLASAPIILQLGEGRHGRRFDASGTPGTGLVATNLAGNKRLANRALRRAGLPVARQMPVETIADVRRAARTFGLPIVLKPEALRAMQGMRIIYGEPDIEAAFAHSAALGVPLLVEKYIPGNEYRVLVMDDAVIAALKRVPATVVGDGRSTIAELVARENTDPRRGAMADGFPLAPMALEALALRYLQECGRTTSDVPAAGERVQIHPLPMMQFGGGAKLDATDDIHPDNREVAIRAVRVLGLDIGGIDFRTPDIARSWREVGAGICEVNPQPNIGLHYDTVPPRDVGRIIVDRVCPPDVELRMCHVVLVGDGDLRPWVADVAQALRTRYGWRVATAAEGAVDLEGFRPPLRVPSLRDAYGLIVEDPTLDAAVYATPAAHIVRYGLGMDRADVGLALAGEERYLRPALATLATARARIARLPADPQAAGAKVLQQLDLRARG
ncbi:MAG: hypothetical protein IT561_23980 [Alphaproteobacteria bacterium]|nr:hypothetical protein [Alphaproteobacteria bacterium]